MIVNEGGGGKRLPDLTNPAAAGDIRTGKQTINEEGEILTGTLPNATQATPTISVSSSGLITAQSIQSAGYVASGTKTATKQLTAQGTKTVTPGTSQQTAVASGRYTTGNVYVAGDTDLKAENIKQGVNIFGVSGTAKTIGVVTTITVQIDVKPTGGRIVVVTDQGDYNYTSSQSGTFKDAKCSVGTNVMVLALYNPNVDSVLITDEGSDLNGFTSLYNRMSIGSDTVVEVYFLRCDSANPSMHLMRP